MGAAAGYVGAHVYEPHAPLQQAYLDAMQAEVLDPLGMSSATFKRSVVLTRNHASPHGEDADGKMQVSSFDYQRAVGPYNPSGGLWTSVHELARFVQVELNRGVTPEGKRVVSEANLLKRREPQISKGAGDSYGMGLHVDHRGGLLVVHHGGDILGFHANWYALPEIGVGAAILTNGDTGAMLREPFLRRLEEVLFDGQPRASADFAALAAAHDEEIAAERPRLRIPADEGAVALLARHYVSPELGTLEVEREERQTVFDFGEWKARVASRKNDDGTTSFLTVDPSADGYELVVGTHHGVRSLHLVAGQQEYFFDEVVTP